MVKQLNLLKTGQIIPTALHLEMEQSYLEYAMSVIVGRALPDVRDGLKPVHRRILYAMHELGLTPDRPYRKCARVVGDVLGKYHPHGDQAVYDALVRLVQDFSSRYPLLSGHGNFGSIDNDPPAAMRYTETRLAPIATEAVLAEISEATVDFTMNFDNSQQEPVVLPAQLPILLLNGCSGIAVGMATNIPPHNLSEVVDGLIALIDRPELPDEKLWEIIQAPDFPTGGEIINLEGVKDAYKSGRGTITVRGVTKIEKIYLGKRKTREKTAIVITELPYQVNKAGWIEKVAELVNNGRIEGIADLRDESDREGIRVVIELKRDAVTENVLNNLYKQTALQTNFGAIMLALVDNQPRQLSLRELLEEFLKFRETTLIRQYNHELNAQQNRLHLVEALLKAINQLDTVITIIREAQDGISAKNTLIEELSISATQADSILAMPLRRLTGLERQKLQTEAVELTTSIAQLQQLLQDRQELLKALKKELRSLKRKFGSSRLTKIVNQDLSFYESSKATAVTPSSSLVPTTGSIVEVTSQGYISWYENKSQQKKQELVVFREKISLDNPLVVITDQGKAYPINYQEIPHQTTQGQELLQRLLPKSVQRDRQKIVTQFCLPDQKSTNNEIVLISQQGKTKRLLVKELESLSNRGLMLIKLKESDSLKNVCLVNSEMELAIATTSGRVLRYRFTDEKIPLLTRNSQGISAISLRHGEELVGCLPVNSQENICLVSELGYGKNIPVKQLRLCSSGDIGTSAFKFINPLDNLVTIANQNTENLILITSNKQTISIFTKDIPISSKDSPGKKIVKLKEKEKIVTVYQLPLNINL